MKKSGKILWLIPLAAILLAATIFMLPVFNLKTIEVETELADSAGEIAFSTELKQGSNMFLTLLNEGNIFTMRFTGAEKRLYEKYEFLENVAVRAVLPSTVFIKFETREPVFEIAYGDRYLVTDIKGCVLGSRDNHVLGFPRITGMEIEQFSLGCIVCGNDPGFEKLADIYNEMKSYDTRFLTAFREYIEWIDVSSRDVIALYFDGRVLVKFDATADVAGQTAAMCRILAEHIKSNEKGTLDFSSGENPVFSPD
ncbi:MAG TPA: hypothetical protein P5315_02460 [Clostridia bacterium]|nr:hypothetical protein [Clostridia bacterium]